MNTPLRHTNPRLAALLTQIPDDMLEPLFAFARSSAPADARVARQEYEAAARRGIVCTPAEMCRIPASCGPATGGYHPVLIPPAVIKPPAPPTECEVDTLHTAARDERRAAWITVLRQELPGWEVGQRASLAAVMAQEQGYRASAPGAKDPFRGCLRSPIAFESGAQLERPRGRVTWTTWRDPIAQKYLVDRDLVQASNTNAYPMEWKGRLPYLYQNEPEVHQFAADVMDQRITALIPYFSIGSTNRYWPILEKKWGSQFWERLIQRYTTPTHRPELAAALEYLDPAPNFNDAVATKAWLVRQTGNPAAAAKYYDVIRTHALSYIIAENRSHS